jgi:hypothetical protein
MLDQDIQWLRTDVDEFHRQIRQEMKPAIDRWIRENSSKRPEWGVENLVALARFIGTNFRPTLDKIVEPCFSQRKLFAQIPAIKLYGCDGVGDFVPDVWMMVWRKGVDQPEGTDIHDHGNSHAGIYLVKGAVSEYVYRVNREEWLDGKDPLRITGIESRHMKAGDTLRIFAPYIHRMLVDHATEGYGVHAYGDPPLDSQISYVKVGDMLHRSETWSEIGVSECV